MKLIADKALFLDHVEQTIRLKNYESLAYQIVPYAIKSLGQKTFILRNMQK